LAEFTGERLIPGQVDADLLNEHMARYAFAARLAQGKRVLDAGCGAGYGAAELAKKAHWVVGADRAAEAVDFAGAHYAAPNLRFEQASCHALPHPDGCFDLVVSFEVIEHLEQYREFLWEARRVLAPGGQFIVSTPNRLYYTESRGAEGKNPYHFHEFELEELRSELAAFFPHVAIFVENHVAGVGFEPERPDSSVETLVEEPGTVPADANFLVAVCALRHQIGSPTFIYLPRTANVLRERERHIGLLESELAEKDAWLEKATRELAEFNARFGALTEDLERSNRWAAGLDRELAERRARVVQVQDELAGAQDAARKMAQGYEAKVAELEAELDDRAAWARGLEDQKRDVEDQLRQIETKLDAIRSSSWYKLFRWTGLGRLI
jgi:SAM-dependent methyltransferase